MAVWLLVADPVRVRRWECQHVAEWGIPPAAVAEPDPPVVFRLDSAQPTERG